MPNITAERFQECVDTYHDQLSASDYNLRAVVSIGEQDRKIYLAPFEIAQSAPDFIACTRAALRDMHIPDAIYRLRPHETKTVISGEMRGTQNQLGSVTAAGAEIALEELIATAGGTTVVFVVVIIAVAASGIADITDALKERERCRRVLDICIEKCTEEAIPSGTWSGDRFFKCRRRCLEAENCWGQSY